MSTLGRFLKVTRSEETDDEALERLRKLVRSEPRSPQFVALAELCRRLGLRDEAVSVCRQGLSYHPNYVSGLVVMGRCCQESGDVVGAIEAYHKVLELAPDNLAGLIGLGILHEQQGALEAALRYFRGAVDLGADDASLEVRIRNVETALAERKRVTSENNNLLMLLRSRVQQRISLLEAYRLRMGLLG